MAEISRRGLIGKAALIGGSILLASSDEALAATAAAPAALGEKGGRDYLPAFEFQPKPLPFNPAKLDGLSERLIVSHHDKNYAGAVKRLGSIQASIAKLPPNTPPFLLGSLKREELVAMNSMILHELYFGNLGGDGRLGGKVEKLINTSFGSPQAWEENFRLVGQSLSGGSGWVILAYSPRDKRVYNVWSADHTINLAAGVPLLVMDMYEHAYQIDYGADAKAYMQAFFKNINWEEVDKRASNLVTS